MFVCGKGMKGRCLPLSPKKSLPEWKVEKEEALLCLNFCLVLSSYLTSQQRWFPFYCAPTQWCFCIISINSDQISLDDSKYNAIDVCLSRDCYVFSSSLTLEPSCGVLVYFPGSRLHTMQSLTYMFTTKTVSSSTLVQCLLLRSHLEWQSFSSILQSENLMTALERSGL